MGSNYVEPEQLARMVVESQQAGQPSDELVSVVRQIARGVLRRHRWRVDHEDAQQEALLALVVHLHKLDARLNVFCYLTQMVVSAAGALWHGDKRQERVVETLSRHCDQLNPDPVAAARHVQPSESWQRGRGRGKQKKKKKKQEKVIEVKVKVRLTQQQKNARWLASLSPQELAAYRQRQAACRRRYADKMRQQKQQGPS